MAKVKISEFSATPANNTDIDGINIAEGCAPSGINDAIRELMAQLKDWQSGTSNDPYVVGSSGSLTLSYGTANGVPYLNGSKVLTSGSALTFDGTNLGIGTSSPVQLLTVESTSNVRATIRNSTENTSYSSSLDFATGSGSLASSNVVARVVGVITQATPSALKSDLAFYTNAGDSIAERMRIDSSGNFLVGGTSALQSATITAYGSVAARNGGVDGNYSNAFVGVYSGNSNEHNAIQTAVSSTAANSGFRFMVSDGGGSSGTTQSFRINRTSCTVIGSLSKGSGSFKIDHPLTEKTDTHHLVHSFIEGPQADLIYRGKVSLVAGTASVDIDTAAGMTEGTFVALCRDVQCFTTNESDWTAVRGSVAGNILTIEAQDNTSTASISWMVIGERKDKHMYDTDWTDTDGKVIVEPLKATHP